jgi:hypothetical protein
MSDESFRAPPANVHSGTRLFRPRYRGAAEPSALLEPVLNLKHLRVRYVRPSITEAARQLHVSPPLGLELGQLSLAAMTLGSTEAINHAVAGGLGIAFGSRVRASFRRS